MMKYGIVYLLVVGVAFTSLSLGQSSRPRSSASSASAGSDSLKAATKPLTPKSAMPSHRQTAAAPKRTSSTNTTAKLAQLERQNSKPNRSTSSGTAGGKDATLKSGTPPAGKGSGIEFKYQKPVGAQRATTRSKSP
jgi:hypothetical protein